MFATLLIEAAAIAITHGDAGALAIDVILIVGLFMSGAWARSWMLVRSCLPRRR